MELNKRETVDLLIFLCVVLLGCTIFYQRVEIKSLEKDLKIEKEYSVDVSLYNSCESYRAAAEYSLALCEDHVDKGRQVMDLYKKVCNPKKQRPRK